MAYKGNNGEYSVGYIAPSPPIGDKESGYFYFPNRPLYPRGLIKKESQMSDYVPDPKKHLYMSLVKSGIRIIGYLALLGIPSGWAIAASVVLVWSEVIGIIEELV
jgi:hypothetical protein